MKTYRNTTLIKEAITQQKRILENTNLTQSNSDSRFYEQLRTYYEQSDKGVPFDKYAYTYCSRWFLQILQNRLQAKGIQLLLDEQLKKFYRLLVLYFFGMKEFEEYYFETKNGKKIAYRLNKGLLLAGTTGRSKSMCMEQIYPILTKKTGMNKYKCLNSFDIQRDFEQYGAKAIKNYETNTYNPNKIIDLYIDEVGAESAEIKHYGNKQTPIQTLLQERYRIFQANGTKTHISTNLAIQDFKTMYGDRVFSRIFEMFNIIIIDGPDLRINLQ